MVFAILGIAVTISASTIISRVEKRLEEASSKMEVVSPIKEEEAKKKFSKILTRKRQKNLGIPFYRNSVTKVKFEPKV